MKMRITLIIVFIFTTLSLRAAPVLFPSEVSKDRLGTELLWQAYLRLPKDKRPHVVLVLGGGGARGLAHIGVLKVFEQEHIPVDEVVGVSVGALIGALYAGGLPPGKIELMANEIGWDRIANVSGTSVVKMILSDSLLSSNKMETYLNDHLGVKTFADLNIPFSCVATDIRTGERIIFQEGPVAAAARASATLPGIFQPVSYRQRSLVDGGLVDNLPVDIARQSDKNSIVIGVLPINTVDRGPVKNMFSFFVRSIDIQKDIIIESQKNKADYLLEPNVGMVSMADLNKGAECIEAGMLEVRRHILEIKKKIL